MLNELFAREILETSIGLGILQEMNGGVVISIATDKEAVKCLKTPLKKGGYNFEERKAFWNSFFDFKAPKLRLPIHITKLSGKDGFSL